jgi:2-haloalkanoic acid dehalogenase type II
MRGLSVNKIFWQEADGEKMIKVVIFDLWNTLVPQTIDLVHLRSLLKKEDISPNEFAERYEKAVQLKIYNSFEELRKDFFAEFGSPDNASLEEILYEVYFNRYDKLHYFAGAEAVLKKLKKQGYKVVLLTNTESLEIGKLEDKLCLKQNFDLLAYSFVVGALKPNRKGFDFVCSKLKVAPEECIMVGDTTRTDIGGAKNAGAHSCLIERKISVEDYIEVKPEFRIKSLDEIFKILGELNKK